MGLGTLYYYELKEKKKLKTGGQVEIGVEQRIQSRGGGTLPGGVR